MSQNAVLNGQRVPTGYLDRLCTLRLHAGYVRPVLARRAAPAAADH